MSTLAAAGPLGGSAVLYNPACNQPGPSTQNIRAAVAAIRCMIDPLHQECNVTHPAAHQPEALARSLPLSRIRVGITDFLWRDPLALASSNDAQEAQACLASAKAGLLRSHRGPRRSW